MCRYCEMIETGVPGEKTNNISIGQLVDGSQIFEVWLYRYIDEESDERTNELILDMSIVSGTKVYDLKDKHIKIKYCPFCGEEL